MRTVTTTYYKFNELSQEAQKAAIEKNRWSVMDDIMQFTSSDYYNTLEKLKEATGFEAFDYEVSYCGMYNNVRVCRNNYDSILDYFTPDEITGRMLFRYVNKIIDGFAKGRWYSTPGRYDENGKYHYKQRYSRIMKQFDNCTLTGMCYELSFEDKLLHYYRHWNEYAKGYSLQDLMEDCYNAFFKDWKAEYDYYGDEDEGIADHMEANDYEFLEDGQLAA